MRGHLSPDGTAADDGVMETVTLPEVHRTGGLIGAELRGLDLTREYPDETYQAILRAWAEHGVIFFRDQPLDAEQRDAFAPGSIAMWDNRQTCHFAINDYQGQRRVMHRILLAGSKPVPAS